MRVLVTGATGFVGKTVCRLLLHRGYKVTAAIRAGSVAEYGCDPVVVDDINGATLWRDAIRGVDAVVHLAARTHQRDDANASEEYRRVNVEGSGQLARAALAAQASVFVYLSSIKAVGECSPIDPDGTVQRLSGEDVPQPLSPYGRSKWEAEQNLQQIAAASEMELVVLRPPLVYGREQKGNLARLMKAIDWGIPLPFAGIDNRRSLIGVENLACAIVLASTSHRRIAGTYTLADVDVSTPQLVEAMAVALGRRARLFRGPGAVFEGIARIGGRSQLEKISSSLLVDSSRFKSALGWEPRYTFEQSLRSAVLSYRGIQTA